MSAESETERADRGCEFFLPPSNELVLRKAALAELGSQRGRWKERKRARERERGGGEGEKEKEGRDLFVSPQSQLPWD